MSDMGADLAGNPGSRVSRAGAPAWRRSPLRAAAVVFCLAMGVLLAAPLPVASAPGGGGGQPETVDITVPGSIAFLVTDAWVATAGTPSPASIILANISTQGNNRLRVSVRADAAEFTKPGGPVSIPVGGVTWLASGAVGGAGYPGTLSTAYVRVYEGNAKVTSGRVDLAWTLAAPPAACFAGNYSLTLRWLVESF